MHGVSKITSEPDVMMITFTGASAGSSLADALTAFAQKGIVVDMICQSAPRAATLDFSFTTAASYFDAAMQTLASFRAKAGPAPLISSGYSKINLFGEEMVTSCGVAALALRTLGQAQIEVSLITTSDLDISLLVRSENEDAALAALRAAFAV